MVLRVFVSVAPSDAHLVMLAAEGKDLQTVFKAGGLHSVPEFRCHPMQVY